jgi:hypothetical protein
MSLMKIRKIVVQVEETLREADRTVQRPSRKAVAAAVIDNPYAGRYVEDLRPFYELGAEVSQVLVERALAALGVTAETVSSYGKGAVVGTAGELEHSAALLHPSYGGPVRAALGGGKAIIPGTKKIGAPGAPITMPMTNKDDIWVFDDMDAAEISIADAPRPNEIMIALCLGVGGRPLHRIGKA